MAHLQPEPTSPYNFGLRSDFEIALIQPFLYFFSGVFLDIYFPSHVAPKPTSPTELAFPNTCTPDEHLTSPDQRRNTIGEQALISLMFILVIMRASPYLDFKGPDPWAFDLPLAWPSFLKNKLLASEHVLPPDDYRVTQRREAMRLLFLVVISGLLCPIADYYCGRGEGAFVFWFDAVELPLSYVGSVPLTIAVILVFYRYGVSWGVQVMMMLSRITLPCVATAAASEALAYATFGRRYGVVDIWDRRIEKWVEAWKKEKSKADREVRDEVEMSERNKELLVWRRGMKEGNGYGPDYWLPREKGPRV